MSLGRFTHITQGLGISVLGLGVGLAASACSPTTSGAAAQPAATRVAASSAATAATASSAPAASSPTAATPAASADPTAAPSSAAAVTPVSNAANAAPVDANGKPFVLWDCESKPQVEPASLVLACGDGGDRMTAMHWTSWAPTHATGTGIQSLNDCTPNCAMGHFHDYPVDISLIGSVLVAQNEPFAYTKITLTYTGPRPTTYTTVNGKVKAIHPATWAQELPIGHPSGAASD
jgi:hypothetical protein